MNPLTRSTPSARSLLLFFAATLLPSPVGAQVLSVTPSSVSAQASLGTNAQSQTVQVRNAGKGALKWSVVQASAAWLSVSPTNGVNSGTLALTFKTSALATGLFQTSFTVQSNGGSQSVAVQVNIGSAPPPPTLTVTCPANATVASPDGSPVAVSYSVSTSGGVAPVSVTGSPASGSSFPIGTTPVQVTAHSTDGQTATCGFSVTVTFSAPPPSGIGPQSTITCPSGSVDIFPGTDNIQAFVDLNPPGTTFCLKAGTFVLRNPIIPKTGDSFVGTYGAVLDGTGWTSTETTHAAFRAYNQDIDYVTIRNLVIRNMPQCGIHAFHLQSDHWTIEYNEIASNRNVGIVFPGYSAIRNNYIHHNTSGGYQGDTADFSTLENNEIAYNGTEEKVMQSASVTFRNNYVHNNDGAGIWYDSDNTGALVEGNRVEDNRTHGIWYEISSDIIIRNNIIRRSGDTGVFISTSKNAQIYSNTLENNFRGITYFVNCPSVGGGKIGFDLANNTAHDNTITVSSTQNFPLASVFNYSCTSLEAAPYLNGSKGLSFSNNAYHVPLPAGQYWYWYNFKVWTEWLAIPQDAGSTVSQ